ncbi:hypothetical protein P38_3075 [Pseudomonas aeruginosa MH38]|nr:hypothetical protein P38_3075 [Pseudomonas aeruginosa MH38]CDH77591.1 hypothetical protein PAMH27_3198 [Pseudomonas aeruginosa MH27]
MRSSDAALFQGGLAGALGQLLGGLDAAAGGRRR